MPLERRSHQHDFLTLRALKAYFAAWLPEGQIDAVLAQSGQSFKKRDGIPEAETKLQLISKSEQALLRILQSIEGQGDRTPRDHVSRL